jgi:hypothetical protein
MHLEQLKTVPQYMIDVILTVHLTIDLLHLPTLMYNFFIH